LGSALGNRYRKKFFFAAINNPGKGWEKRVKAKDEVSVEDRMT